mmetsp:Transcript_3735/g.7145  ORF Transcript_3735/g.7145 Transcript_3735/m.7145 type:complete len:342 (+) Transcript_3735:29-1054(+)
MSPPCKYSVRINRLDGTGQGANQWISHDHICKVAKADIGNSDSIMNNVTWFVNEIARLEVTSGICHIDDFLVDERVREWDDKCPQIKTIIISTKRTGRVLSPRGCHSYRRSTGIHSIIAREGYNDGSGHVLVVTVDDTKRLQRVCGVRVFEYAITVTVHENSGVGLWRHPNHTTRIHVWTIRRVSAAQSDENGRRQFIRGNQGESPVVNLSVAVSIDLRQGEKSVTAGKLHAAVPNIGFYILGTENARISSRQERVRVALDGQSTRSANDVVPTVSDRDFLVVGIVKPISRVPLRFSDRSNVFIFPLVERSKGIPTELVSTVYIAGNECDLDWLVGRDDIT